MERSKAPAVMPPPNVVARLLSGVSSGCRIRCPGPGHSARDQSLEVWIKPDAPEGFLVHSFAGDDPIKCRDHVKRLLNLGHVREWQAAPRRTTVGERCVDDDLRRRLIAQTLWARSVEARGTHVETYLRRRGIHCAAWPATLRYLPANPPAHLWPTMLAAYGEPQEPDPGVLRMPVSRIAGVQLTYLKRDGSGKAPIDPQKRSIGRGHAAPIVLAPLNDGLGLVVAEGIEDALSLHQETGLAAWAAGGASRLPMLAQAVPHYVETVTIAADDNEAGHRGSSALRSALLERGIHAETIILQSSKKDCRDGAENS